MKIVKIKKGLVTVQLDISKAFDTVPHAEVEDALSRKGVPRFITKTIRTPTKTYTIIKRGTREVPMRIKRGVKQGDPLSPLIFNVLIQPLINKRRRRRDSLLTTNVRSSSWTSQMIPGARGQVITENHRSIPE